MKSQDRRELDLLHFQAMFLDERACVTCLFEQRWPEGFVPTSRRDHRIKLNMIRQIGG